MGRAAENFNNVYFRNEIDRPQLTAQYASVLRHIFWNLMDGHSLIRESDQCSYVIESWGKRCYLVETHRLQQRVSRYEIMNCTYEQLRNKISKKHAAEEMPAR